MVAYDAYANKLEPRRRRNYLLQSKEHATSHIFYPFSS